MQAFRAWAGQGGCNRVGWCERQATHMYGRQSDDKQELRCGFGNQARQGSERCQGLGK